VVNGRSYRAKQRQYAFRPSRARPSVKGSAYSRSPPMGTPLAMRVIRRHEAGNGAAFGIVDDGCDDASFARMQTTRGEPIEALLHLPWMKRWFRESIAGHGSKLCRPLHREIHGYVAYAALFEEVDQCCERRCDQHGRAGDAPDQHPVQSPVRTVDFVAGQVSLRRTTLRKRQGLPTGAGA